MMIQLKNFSVNNLYDDLSCTFPQGQVTCIMGENGCGKSMLAKYILGIYNNYQGQIIIDEQELTDENYSGLRKNIKLINQNPHTQFIGNTVFDEVTYKLEQNKLSRKQIEQILIEDFITFDLKQPLHTLSAAKSQELLVRSSLSFDESVLIIDEAFSNTTKLFKDQIFNLLKELNTTVILITNNIYDTTYADSVFVLQEKKLTKATLDNIDVFIKHQPQAFDQAITITNFKTKNLDYYLNVNFSFGFNVIDEPSGIGKSSIFYALMGLIKYSGTIRNNFKKLGFVSQYPINQITRSCVIDELRLTKADDESIDKMFNHFGLDKDLYTRELITLSTGQLSQIMIICQLLRKVDCLLLDEVIEVIDYKKQRLFLKYLADHNITTIFISNNIRVYNDYPYYLAEIRREHV